MTAAVKAPIPREMVDHEQALLAAYRRADERGRQSILELALSTCEDWPAPISRDRDAVGCLDPLG